jgi:hypothetical protein
MLGRRCASQVLTIKFGTLTLSGAIERKERSWKMCLPILETDCIIYQSGIKMGDNYDIRLRSSSFHQNRTHNDYAYRHELMEPPLVTRNVRLLQVSTTSRTELLDSTYHNIVYRSPQTSAILASCFPSTTFPAQSRSIYNFDKRGPSRP